MKRVAAIVIGMVAVLSLVFVAAESAGWMDPGRFRSLLETVHASPTGRLAVAGVIGGLLAGDLVLPVPSSVLMTLAGAFLGTAAGTAVSFAGAMASALIGFAVCRRFGHAAFRRFAGEADADRVTRFLRDYGVWGILLSRSVPMLTEVVSCVAGLSDLPFRTFASLAAAGTLPICAVYAWAGARASDPSGLGWAVLIAFLVPAAGFAAVRRFSLARPRKTP
ncbi:MAG: VTT domain-containing protein [Lentisphaerae bacterium]|nr:VTT domain-containing protein [Lentisphaerota bacterium]